MKVAIFYTALIEIDLDRNTEPANPAKTPMSPKPLNPSSETFVEESRMADDGCPNIGES